MPWLQSTLKKSWPSWLGAQGIQNGGTEKNMEFMGTIWELWIYLWGKPKGIIIWEHLIFQKFSHGMKSFGAD